ncbi:MAG: glycosyltransferase, partial [Oceanobacter sp.]
MAPTRICVITETYVPDVNGVANSLRQLIKSLDPEQYLVQIIRTRPRTEWKPEVEEVWCKGVSIPMYPDLQIGLPASNIIKAAWDRFQPDIVFIATEGLLGYSGLKIAKARNLPVLSAFH